MSEEDATKTKELLEEITPKVLSAHYAVAAAKYSFTTLMNMLIFLRRIRPFLSN